MKTLITVITVTHNDCEQLRITIENILNLKRDDIDHIIIDAASNDGTLNMLHEFNNQLHYWISEPDNGIYDAMNKGWNLADIDSYILFLGAGDKVLRLPKKDDFLDSTIIYGNTILEKYGLFKSRLDFRLMLGNTLHHQSLMIPKKISPLSPFNSNYKIYADFDFNQKLLLEKRNFIKSDIFLSYAKGDGVSSAVNQAEIYKIVRKNFGILIALISSIYIFINCMRKKYG